MSDQQAHVSVDLAISDLRRLTEVGFAEVKGSLGLLLQRADQADRRDEELSKQVEAVKDRISTVERTAVTRKGVYALMGLFIAALTGIAAWVAIFVA